MIYKLEALTERLTGVHIADEGHLENTIQLPPFDPVQEEVHMIILTAPDGHNSGRAYVHHLPPDSAQRWFDYLTRYVRKAKRREHTRQLDQQFGTNKFLRYRALAREMYESTPFQLFIAFLIVSSFACDIGDAQFLPSDGSTLSKFFQRVDISITVLFLLELLLNLFAHSNDWFKPFYSSVANWFDVFIVMVSLISLGLTFGSALPDAKLLRLLRLGRMVRMMQSFKSLHKLIVGIQSSVPSVCNAAAILISVACVYAVIGTHLFKERSEEYFGNFSRALFTMFQVLTGDSWASGVSRSLFQDDQFEAKVAIFFISYILVAGVMLFNVVIAVLLDEFVASVSKEKQEAEVQERLHAELRKVTGCLDPLTRSLITFEDEEDLTVRIDGIYQQLDRDDSEGLTFEEFRDGVRMLSSNSVHLTRDDFDIVTENGKLLGPDGAFNRQQFQSMMKGELWRYSRRLLSNDLLLLRDQAADSHFVSTILAHKLMETRIAAAEKRETQILDQILSSMDRLQVCVKALAAGQDVVHDLHLHINGGPGIGDARAGTAGQDTANRLHPMAAGGDGEGTGKGGAGAGNRPASNPQAPRHLPIPSLGDRKEEEEDDDDATQAQTTKSCEGLLGELIQKFDQQQRTLEEQGAQLETLKHLLHRSVVSIRDPHQPPSVLDSLHLQRPRAIPQELPQGTSEGEESPRDRSTDVSAALMRARNRFYLLSTPGKT